MKGDGDDDRYSEAETARRADEVTRRMINTPPKPRIKPSQKKQRSVRKANRRGSEPDRSG